MVVFQALGPAGASFISERSARRAIKRLLSQNPGMNTLVQDEMQNQRGTRDARREAAIVVVMNSVPLFAQAVRDTLTKLLPPA
jgi:hypothetical protein